MKHFIEFVFIGVALLILANSRTIADDIKVSRGYSIPTIDLSDQSERQVVIDREPGQYLGHPTTVLLEDNKTMICVYPKGHGRGAIVMKRSTDAGLTWSDRLPRPESWATSREVPTIHRVVDAAGKKRLIMFSGLYPIRMAVSEDDGRTWSELEPIGKFGGIVTMGSVVELNTGAGHYMALFHDDGRFLRGGPKNQYGSPAGDVTRFNVYKTVTTDGGLTWSEPEVIATHATAHLCEPGAIRSPDGKQIAVLLRENSRRLNSFVIFSDDEGKTWSEPSELPGSLTGDRHTGRYAPDGRLFISFRDTTHESPTKGDWVAWVGTYDDIVEGREGQYRVRLMDNHRGADCAYPGVEVLPDGTFVTTTYGHWTPNESPYVVSVRLKLEELDALASAKDEQAESQASEEKGEDDFVSLFDGKSLDGWHVMNDGSFVAEDEVIKLKGGRGWLRSDKEYSNFVLRLEVRWMKPRQDSGIFLRASKEGNNWPNRRYEVQCENSERVAHIFGAQHERDKELAVKLLKEDQQWNSYEVKCEGKRCEVKFNGELVATSDSFEQATGYIGLQGEGGQLEFRNISIKVLP